MILTCICDTQTQIFQNLSQKKPDIRYWGGTCGSIKQPHPCGSNIVPQEIYLKSRFRFLLSYICYLLSQHFVLQHHRAPREDISLSYLCDCVLCAGPRGSHTRKRTLVESRPLAQNAPSHTNHTRRRQQLQSSYHFEIFHAPFSQFMVTFCRIRFT